jgi:hypothetical protein
MKKDIVTRYIELLYSEKSELNEIQNLEERKKEAARLAGMNVEAKSTIQIMTLQNRTVNRQIFDYLTATQRNIYISLISDQQLFWEIEFDKMTPTDKQDRKSRMADIKAKATMSKESDSLLNRINYKFREIFRHDDEIKMAGDMVRMMTVEERIKKNSA